MLGGKNCLNLSRGGEEGDYLIRKIDVADGNCGVEEKLAWGVEKIEEVGTNREFGKE